MLDVAIKFKMNFDSFPLFQCYNGSTVNEIRLKVPWLVNCISKSNYLLNTFPFLYCLYFLWDSHPLITSSFPNEPFSQSWKCCYIVYIFFATFCISSATLCISSATLCISSSTLCISSSTFYISSSLCKSSSFCISSSFCFFIYNYYSFVIHLISRLI